MHTHLVIANRVMAPDGRWLALDARTLKCDQRTISALYAAGLRAEVTARLGVRWKPVENGLAEMADAPEEVLAALSERTRQMATRRDAKVERFVAYFDRQPTARERWKIDRNAARESRPSKASADADLLHDHWHDQMHDLGHDPEHYVARLLGQVRAIGADDAMDQTAVTEALSQLRDTQSVWRPAEVLRDRRRPTNSVGFHCGRVGRAARTPGVAGGGQPTRRHLPPDPRRRPAATRR